MLLPNIKVRLPLLRNIKLDRVLADYLAKVETAHINVFRDLRQEWGKALDFCGLSLGVLSTTKGVDMQTSAKVNLYTVPAERKAAVHAVLIYAPSVSLAGGIDYDFGDGVACTTWKQAVDLSTMTSTDHYFYLTSDNVAYNLFDAGDVFGIKPITGSTAAATANIKVIGIEHNA